VCRVIDSGGGPPPEVALDCAAGLRLPLPELQSPAPQWFAAFLRTAALAPTILLGVATHARGTFCTGATFWNVAPLDVDEHPERVWDWGDLQMFRGYCGP